MSSGLSRDPNQFVSRSSQSAIVIIGIGNEFGRDDAVGLVVARVLKEKGPPGVRIVEASGEPTSLIEMWNGADIVILIDAVRTGARAGTIYRVDAHAEPIPASLACHSTHAIGIVEAVELARVLNRLPPRLIIYGIEGRDFAVGIGLSQDVQAAADDVSMRIADEVSQWIGEV